MSFNDVLDLLGDIAVLLIGPPLIVFMVAYAKNSPWRATPLGIERMFKSGYLFLLWLVVVAGNYLPDELETIRLLSRLTIFVIVVAGLWIQVINLRRVQIMSPRPLVFTSFTYGARSRKKARKAAASEE